MSDDSNKPPLPPTEVVMTSDSIQKNDIPFAIEDIMHGAYLQYSLSVNVGRAVPDVRDGLKVGNRRILYAMRQLGFTKSHAYTKCAKVVGEVIGNYHPHGDQAVYDTLVRMAQDFSMRYPLVDGQGNFGSIDGDSAAAYRYTECRMERLTEELLADLEKETVDMRTTFDEKTLEPSVLPARFPNLLVNGATGIGVGMATSIPPHNLGEVIDATIAIIDQPGIGIAELMHYLPGPDFPTGGIIQGIRSINALYHTGRGSVRIRGKASIEEKQGKEQIIITEIPYALNKENLVLKIADLVNEKRITGISGLEDLSSSRVGIRIVIDIKKGAIASVVLNQLYSMTPLESVMGAQFLVVDRNRPRTLNLKQILEAYIDHREDVIIRRTRFELKKAEDRDHIVQGLLIAQANIDDVVRIIRESANRDDASRTLMARFELSERQVKAILEMRLYQLTNLAVDELRNEHEELTRRIEHLKRLLASRKKIMDVVREELIEVRNRYADARRSLIVPAEREIDMEDLIPRGICVVPLSATGYIKRVPADTYEAQNRGGKGVRGMRTRDEDYVDKLLTCCTHDIILFFTNKGLMHWLKAYELPEGSRDSQGKAIINLLQLQSDERIRAMISVNEVDVEGIYVVMATRNGTVKKTELRAFKNLRRRGIIAINLEEGDDLIEVQLTDGKQELLLSSAEGRACRFLESGLRPTGRNSIGVRGMELRNHQGERVTELVAMCVVEPEDELLVITAKGMGKRTPIGLEGDGGETTPGPESSEEDSQDDNDSIASDDEDSEVLDDGSEDSSEDSTPKDSSARRYRRTRRGARGVISIRLREDDRVVAALQVLPDDEEQEILITSVQGQMVRLRVSEFRSTGRAAFGTIIMRLNDGDEVASATLIDELSEDEIAANKAKIAEEEEQLARKALFDANRAAMQRKNDGEVDEEEQEEQDGDENLSEDDELSDSAELKDSAADDAQSQDGEHGGNLEANDEDGGNLAEDAEDESPDAPPPMHK
jgi:DNA gyrase subunit A